jgi:hypothetical protein
MLEDPSGVTFETTEDSLALAILEAYTNVAVSPDESSPLREGQAALGSG